MPAASSRPGRPVRLFAPRAIPTHRACCLRLCMVACGDARWRPSRAARPIWRTCRRDAPSRRVAGLSWTHAVAEKFRWQRPKPAQWPAASGRKSWWLHRRTDGWGHPVALGRKMDMDKTTFASLVDSTGLKLTDDQKATLFAVYPMFEAMIARAT